MNSQKRATLHKLRLTENAVGVPNNLFKLWSSTVLWRWTSQRLEILPRPGSRLPMMVVIFQQLQWNYQFEPADKAAACLCAR